MKKNNCFKCGKTRARHVLAGSKNRLCGECFAANYEERVRKANHAFGILRRGDRVVVAVSGGKDSGAMLAVLQKIAGEINSQGDSRAPEIELVPVHVNCGIPRYSEPCERAARALCKKLGIPLTVKNLKTEFGVSVADAARRGARPPCTYCGVLRKTLFNRIARELGANKVAIGHTCDDYAQTFLMNVMRFDERRLANAAELDASEGAAQEKGFVRRIRPLAFVFDEEGADYARLQRLPFHAAKCPHSRGAKIRGLAEDFLNEAEREFPGTKYSFLRAALAFGELVGERGKKAINKNDEKAERREWRRCVRCGEACSREKCMSCELLEELRS